MSDERKLTLKQRKWLKIYLKTGNATLAAQEVYECKDDASAANIGWENVRKLEVPISELMDSMGITDGKLISKVTEGLEATKVISANVIASDGEGMKDANSMTRDFIDVPDYAVQHKFLETALKLKGKFPKDGPAVGIVNTGSMTIEIE